MSGLDEVHDLYRIDPAEFVEARAALVKQLRADKRADEARAVVKLRKPTGPSWALDQVAHEEPALIEAALAAGEALEAATTETLEGDASNLRAATEAERTASNAVIDAAGAHLALTADVRDRMASTLRAAISDDDVRTLLTAGLLAADHEPPAMGFAATAAAGPEPTAPEEKARAEKAPAKKGAAKAQLAEAPKEEEPPARARRKVRRVGTPSSAKRAPVDEVEARRKTREVVRLQAEEAERKRAEEERARERRRQQAALDSAAAKARSRADKLDDKARRAEEAAAAARQEADAAIAEAVDAEAAAEAGPPD
ncbi:MAG: hypothetical protein JWO77_512 [Ilumatobacteraceae bacterium]|nr:hypothetical protein [Ilumatobacteraceae bacterium]